MAPNWGPHHAAVNTVTAWQYRLPLQGPGHRAPSFQDPAFMAKV